MKVRIQRTRHQIEYTCNVAEESLVRSWSKQRNPVILAASRRDCTSKFSYANEDGKVAEPDDCKAVDETSWPATVIIRSQCSAWIHVEPTSGSQSRKYWLTSVLVLSMHLTLTLAGSPKCTSNRMTDRSYSPTQTVAVKVSPEDVVIDCYEPSTPVAFPLLPAHNDRDRSPVPLPLKWKSCALPVWRHRQMTEDRYASPWWCVYRLTSAFVSRVMESAR
jgi:hypothetical protein